MPLRLTWNNASCVDWLISMQCRTASAAAALLTVHEAFGFVVAPRRDAYCGALTLSGPRARAGRYLHRVPARSGRFHLPPHRESAGSRTISMHCFVNVFYGARYASHRSSQRAALRIQRGGNPTLQIPANAPNDSLRRIPLDVHYHPRADRGPVRRHRGRRARHQHGTEPVRCQSP
ncbi:protein of unknown function [Cupriavidus neocaledonicus]|uniref:Uncharacterized protein n=1 Tax=Cupriavidus neocaledonicus TaxID=1040979 RepID=A0A375H4E1_9BURK|nr:hypothetical protein CBM2605_A10065 [Cupriavidus neocaledonicus]SPD45107.1 protein of unknown function [Cupriavidus neocaledonicus]